MPKPHPNPGIYSNKPGITKQGILPQDSNQGRARSTCLLRMLKLGQLPLRRLDPQTAFMVGTSGAGPCECTSSASLLGFILASLGHLPSRAQNAFPCRACHEQSYALE